MTLKGKLTYDDGSPFIGGRVSVVNAIGSLYKVDGKSILTEPDNNGNYELSLGGVPDRLNVKFSGFGVKDQKFKISDVCQSGSCGTLNVVMSADPDELPEVEISADKPTPTDPKGEDKTEKDKVKQVLIWSGVGIGVIALTILTIKTFKD